MRLIGGREVDGLKRRPLPARGMTVFGPDSILEGARFRGN